MRASTRNVLPSFILMVCNPYPSNHFVCMFIHYFLTLQILRFILLILSVPSHVLHPWRPLPPWKPVRCFLTFSLSYCLYFTNLSFVFCSGHSGETGGYFIPGWTLRDDVRMNSFRACREMMDHLATPAESEALSGLNNNQLVRQAYINVGSGVVLQAELLQRFGQLNRDHRELSEVHDGCGDRLRKVETERDAKVQSFDKLLKEFRALEDEVSAASTRQEGLVEQLEEMEKNRNEWQSTASSQAAKIRELEGQLSLKSTEIGQLQEKNKQLTASVAQSEVMRHNTVKELIPAVCHRLFQSREYKKSMGKVYSLSYTAGFVDGVKADFRDGVKVARDEDDVERVLGQVKNLNREAPSLWKAEFNKIFEAEYPYVKTIAESYRLPLGDLMNLLPEGSVVPEKSTPATGPSEPKND